MDPICTQDEKSKALLLSSHSISSYDAIIKEMLENSLDAAATNIDIEINFDGIPNIKVSDNGSGMDTECMKKLGNRYHSSKSFDEDSSRISSLGFRGEALSSIIAMAEAVKIFSFNGSVEFKRGVLEQNHRPIILKSTGATFIIVDPFHSVPVRKRLLSEVIPKIITRLTELAREYYAFNNMTLRLLTRYKEKEKVLLLRESNNMAERLEYLFRQRGKHASQALESCEISYVMGECERQLIAIKSRPVVWRKMALMLKRLDELSGIKIMAIDLRLSVAFDLNIDPDKRTVFMHDEKQIINQIEEFFLAENTNKKHIIVKERHLCETDHCTTLSNDSPDTSNISPFTEAKLSLDALNEVEYNKEHFKGFIVVGNFNNSFIIVKLLNNDFILIDQHAADERVNLEKFEAEYKPDIQNLLISKEFELNPEDFDIAKKHSDNIAEKLGFSYALSDAAYNVTLVKAPIVGSEVLGGSDLAIIIQSIKLEGRVCLRHCEKLAVKMASKACKSSIRLGDNINVAAMQKVRYNNPLNIL